MAESVVRRHMASLSDNPEKWRGQTQLFHRKPQFDKTKSLREFTLHWRSFPRDPGYHWMVVTTGEGSDAAVVATLYCGPWQTKDKSRLEGAVEVDPGYRRKGLATAMYDWAEDLTGLMFAPAPEHSSDAELFWRARHSRFSR